ncbi:MAG: hypothetical protein WC975_06405 [Phycisphaerae bacterium]
MIARLIKTDRDCKSVMSKTESTLIGLVLCFIFPVTFFLLFAAVVASMVIYHLAPLAERHIPICAFVGLAVGIILLLVRWQRWVSGFYTARNSVLIPLYLFWSAVATAVFMGLPIGLWILGLLAGIYIGKRGFHADLEPDRAKPTARRTGLFTSAVTGGIVIVLGLLTLQGDDLNRILASFGLDKWGAKGLHMAVIASAVVFTTVIQYTLTYAAAAWAGRIGKRA